MDLHIEPFEDISTRVAFDDTFFFPKSFLLWNKDRRPAATHEDASAGGKIGEKDRRALSTPSAWYIPTR